MARSHGRILRGRDCAGARWMRLERTVDNTTVDVSVVIPTYGRPQKAAACVRALAAQTMERHRFEVLIGIDGPDEWGTRAAIESVAGELQLQIVDCPRAGYNAVRNLLLERCRGTTLVSLNDDVTGVPGLLEAHHREQERWRSAGGGEAIVVGSAPWKRVAQETLFDRLVRETSMVFFFDQMDTPSASADPDRDWGFRHCWGLNFSAPLHAVRAVGGFTAFELAYGYDDIELAFRLQRRFGMPVLYRPAARVEHDHRYLPEDVLRRERQLGNAAWHFAGANPAFAAAVFGRDIRCGEELAYSREFVRREAKTAERMRASLLGLAQIPAGAIAGEHAAELIDVIHQQHLLLKRWEWRRGLLHAAGDDSLQFTAHSSHQRQRSTVP